ncbi:MAG TPA: aminopeptidase P family protein [Desulfobacteraceae bacterium]|nr:aminopeptidase P family protein [Deltaproteobacteria bacterium]RLB97957.1 MAG: aminopeptidase P family protein [Deltaproteobacteria bacterium]HDI59337.1 aminopeptidase P family protein [Desulfobacteraceae bacterium]
MTPIEEISARTTALQAQLCRLDLDGALLAQNTDLFYFSGTLQQSHLYVPAQGEPVLMVRKHLPRAQAESPLERIVALGSPREIPALLQRFGLPLPRRLGLELDVLPAQRYIGLCRLLPDAEMIDISDAVRQVRAVKSPYEIEKIKEAARRADAVQAAVPGLIEAGISEVALAGRIEAEARRLGHQGVVRMRLWGAELFYGHLMSGANAAAPSFLASPTGGRGLGPAVAQGPSLAPVAAGVPILVDYVFAYDGYLADQTRIYVIGKLPDTLRRAHEAMMTLQDELAGRIRPGAVAGDLYQWSLERAANLGYSEHFMGTTADRIRFVGHGIGLELDEYPFLAQGQSMELVEGMIVALEPKLIFPEMGVVGIENTWLVTADGGRRLTQLPDGVVSV